MMLQKKTERERETERERQRETKGDREAVFIVDRECPPENA